MANEEVKESGVVRSAPLDLLLAERLAIPVTAAGIYLEEASLFRPIATGDIFRGVSVPGSTDDESQHDLTMIVAHPSAMRQGASLEDRAQAAPIFPIAGVKRSDWTPNRFDIFPLPLLSKVAATNGFEVPNKAWAADLRLCGPIPTTRLDVRKRVAVLSPEGVVLLLQRLVHTDTRAAVRVDTLTNTFSPKLDEIELLETWNEELVGPMDYSGDQLLEAIDSATEEFDSLLSKVEPRSGKPLRELLEHELTRAEARRNIMTELRSRRDLGQS